MDHVPHFTLLETSRGTALSAHVREAVDAAFAMRSRLIPEVFAVEGFSGRKIRVLINTLLSVVPSPRYLEIGIYKGASFIPALFENSVKITGIDNWSEFNETPNYFYQQLAKFRAPGTVVNIIENDFRKIDYTAIGTFNVMFYDGSHAREDQYDGVAMPIPAMDQEYVLMVDDWNWERVRSATLAALNDHGCEITFSAEVRTSLDNEMTLWPGMTSDWHNGFFIATVSRAKAFQ